jgi:integration host factor subunit alpha
MSEKTLTRMDLSESVFREVGLSRNESADLVESVLEKISASLVACYQVKIYSFGTFSIRQKNARVGRNPKTGEEAPIPPRRVLTFRPSHLMKDRVSEGK